MKFKNQRRMAASVLKVGEGKIWFDFERREDIKKAITKNDIRDLIKQGAIVPRPTVGVSRVRAREHAEQKRKGRRSGLGSRKGKRTARLPRKKEWMLKIRAQRGLLDILKSTGKITGKIYRELRQKAKGGFFRSRRHIKLYAEDRGLIVKDGKK